MKSNAITRTGLVLLTLIGMPSLHLGGTETWRSTIQFPDDPFIVSRPDLPGWVKFIILTDDPTTVYFQDSNAFPFHYEFATTELAPFIGMTPAEFDAVTLHEDGQLAVLGAVLVPPEDHLEEFGIQLVRRDPYPPDEVVALFDTVRAAVIAEPSVRAFYFPTFEQQQSAEQNRDYLASQGVEISSTARWADANACYSKGWALGRVTYVPGEQIESAYLAGSLEPEDILLTDAVPAEIPFVAGIISLAPSTPSSHVAILAGTFGVPFVHLALADDAAQAVDLIGRRIVLRALDYGHGVCAVRLFDVEGALDQQTIDEILTLKVPPALAITPIEPLGSYSANTSGLGPSDIRYFGGKAANFGFLRRAVPADSPVAGAFSFDLWTAFMGQAQPGNVTLGERIASMLAGISYPPPEMAALDAILNDVRDLIKDTDETLFTPELETAVLTMLQDPQYGFDPDRKIRFRSSTNVEDAEQFTGAGLYDSYSGCLSDDLDGDAIGPSRCDPTRPDERGVFRAIRKVLASFYNMNAYLERLRHGVNEADVGMAILVHHSFPDEIEMANGVAEVNDNDVDVVSQIGAVSVTNPEPGVLPEIVDVTVFSFFTGIDIVQYSNLVLLGDTVLDHPDDYEDLADLLIAVAELYEQETGIAEPTLEFEFKKVAPDGSLVVKQVRRLPPGDQVPSVTPFLLNDPTNYCVFQGEFSDEFASHRLKSRWNVETASMWMTPENLQAGFFGQMEMHYGESCIALEQSGPFEEWPAASHEFLGSTVTVGWEFDFLQIPRTHGLSVSSIPTLVPPAATPIWVLEDWGCLALEATYAASVPAWDGQGPTMTLQESVNLCKCPEENEQDEYQQRNGEDPGTASIETSYYWPPRPGGIVIYTAPLSRFDQTTISGLTEQPIVLRGELSQTYRPEHHNFGEVFIFEPGLEPGISDEQMDQLDAAGVRAVRAYIYEDVADFTYYDAAAWQSVCLDCLGDDVDDDGRCTLAPTFDCDDGDSGIWATPGEARALSFANPETLSWLPPSEPGAETLVFDTLMARSPDGFLTQGVCVETNGQDTQTVVSDEPAVGALQSYLVRAENACPLGQGSLGAASNGIERSGVGCSAPPISARLRRLSID